MIKLILLSILLLLPCAALAQTDCLTGSANCHIETTQTGTITSARVNHTNEAASLGAGLGAAAMTAYIFEIRPELQRLHNEKINAIEGKFQDEYEQLDGLITVNAPNVEMVPESVTVHGHSLGETWTQFLALSPKLQQSVVTCTKRPPTKQTNKHRVYDPCADIRYLADGGTSKVTFDCRNNVKAKDEKCQDFDGEVTFMEGKLTALKIVLPGVTMKDAQLKFGAPSGTDGDGTSDVWHSGRYAVATDKMDNGIALAWMNSEQYAALVNAQSQLPDDKPQVSQTGASRDF